MLGNNLANGVFLNVYQDGKLIGSKQGSKVAKIGRSARSHVLVQEHLAAPRPGRQLQRCFNPSDRVRADLQEVGISGRRSAS